MRLRPLPDKRRGGGTADRARAAGAGSPRPVHEALVHQVSTRLTGPELDALCQALARLHGFFTELSGETGQSGPEQAS